MKLPWNWLLVAASTLLLHCNAATIETKRADVENDPDVSLNHVYFPFGYPFPSLIGLEGIPSYGCEYTCAPGDPHAPKCKCIFKPALTGCRAYGCDTSSPTAAAKPDPSDPDNCKACEAYAHGCSLRSRLYCPRMMCEGGDKTVPKQCWLGGKCQKVSKDAHTYWCQSPGNFPNKRDTMHNTLSQEDIHVPLSNSDVPLSPNMGIVGPVMIIPPKVDPAPAPVPAPPAPPQAPKQSVECEKCNDELGKCTAKALCDYKQSGQDYCVEGCKRYVCNFARPKCRDTCFKDECGRLNAVWRGLEYNGF